MKAIIIGNGIAGIMTAARLRQLEKDQDKLSVEIYTREAYEYYSRIRLPEVFGSALTAGELALYKPGWYEARNIKVFKNKEVSRLDRQAKTVHFTDGTQAAYDKLVLTLGAESIKLPIPKADLKGIFTVREYEDAAAVRSYISQGTKRAVVIGGGLLGLEAARNLLGPKVGEVTVLETMPRLLPRQLDAETSRFFQKAIEALSLRVVTGKKVVEFLGTDSVRRVKLDDGSEIEAETVLIAVGIKPRVAVAKAAGLTVNRGVVVDERLKTSDPDIYAAGDIAEFQGIVWGIIPAALEHASVVADNILGLESSYSQTLPQNTLKIAGIELASLGNATVEEGPGIKIFRKVDEKHLACEKFVLENGLLTGSILLGAKRNLRFVQTRLGKACTEEELAALPFLDETGV